MLLVAEDVWQNLSVDEQDLISQAAIDASEYNDNLVSELEQQQLAEVQAEMNVTEPDMDPWREATADVYMEFSDVEGFVELYESIRDWDNGK